MIPVKCPICGKSSTIATLDDLPSFPFCSSRCRTIDQARWADGAYAIPDKTLPGTASADDLDDEDDG